MAPSQAYEAAAEGYDVFISHCKKADGTEDRALWCVDVFEEAGMKPFFDLQNLEEISREQLIKDVKASKALVTVIDPETFNSEWVLLENQTAVDHNIPIVPFYDGDRWKWNDISFWVSKHPAFFKIPAIEYHRTYHKQSKALLISKAKGQKRFSEQLTAPNEVVATAAQKLAIHMKELLAKQILPPQCAKLCRASDNLCGEAGALLPELVEEASVDSTLADIRSCVEDTQEMVHTMDGLAPPKTGGGGGCCGGSKGGKNMVAVAPAPIATVDGLLSKDVELAALRGALRRVLGDARRAVRLKRAGSTSTIAEFWKGLASGDGGSQSASGSWDDLMKVLTEELRRAGAEDAELQAAADRAAGLLPKLKAKLVDSTGAIRSDALKSAFGEDGGGVTGVLLDAAQGTTEEEKVFSPEIKALSGGAGGVPSDLPEFADVGFLMLRGAATLAELRARMAQALATTSFKGHAAEGSYTFYLHDGKTAVSSRQEGELLVFEQIPGLLIVPGAAPAAARVAADDNAAAGPAVDALFAEAKEEVESEERETFAAALTLSKVLEDADLLNRFKRLTYGELPEENVQFLSEMAQLRSEMAPLPSDEAKFAFLLPKLRFIHTTFVVKVTTMKLSADLATREAATASFQSAIASAKSGTRNPQALIACFEAVEAEVSAVCERLLPKLRSAVTTVGPLKGIGKARRTVIVVGGGIAGSFTARWFDRFYHDRLDTILVDPKEYHEITFMTLRATVQDNNGFQKRMRVPHRDYVAHGQVVIEQCQEVAPDHIKVGSSGKDLHVIPFDYLFLSTGCHYSENIKTNSPSMAYRIQQYEAERRKIVESKRVLIIGAGVVGNELCGEIIDAFPKKEVIMVGRSTILSRAGPEAHRMIADHWASKGVKCIFNEEMMPYTPGDTHYVTAKGTKIPVDGTRAFWCLGRQAPNTWFLKKHFGSAALDPLGYIKVDGHCRVQGVSRGNIFAAGDCVFAPAHPGGDRGHWGFHLHSFIARENIVALHEQLSAGKTPELCESPQQMPFQIDPNCESGTGACWVEPLKMLSVGHNTFFLKLTAFPKGAKNLEIPADFAAKVKSGEVKTHCWMLKKGSEARQKVELERGDMLRDTKTTPISKDKAMPHAGFKHQPPGKDVKDFMMFNELFVTRPKLAKFIMVCLYTQLRTKKSAPFSDAPRPLPTATPLLALSRTHASNDSRVWQQQMFFKGQYDDAVLTDAQAQEAEEAEAKLAELGDEFEIIASTSG